MDIHNFAIISHIDHGKSTLADRLLELTKTVEARQMREQVLDSMDLEREKGITIKLQPVRMEWKGSVLNLIDTPGHVDFQYEVSRSLAAVEGALLLVDATQGVQAQTLANLYLAIEQDLTIIPVINKIDLPAANVEAAVKELTGLLGETAIEPLLISAKTGEGVPAVLDAIVQRIPKAAQQTEQPLRGLIFDSVYDDYKGVIAYVRIVEGSVKRGQTVRFLGTDTADKAIEVGSFQPKMTANDTLSAGEIGYIASGLKDIRQVRVGDTVAADGTDADRALTGFSIPQPKVFAGLYPLGADEFPRLREAIEKLQLNDASLTAAVVRSEALGQGYRCGFLGMLHLEIVQERIRREDDLELVVTTPSVLYRVTLTDGKKREVATPAQFPDPARLQSIEEQFAVVDVLVPQQYVGAVFELMQVREGVLDVQEQLEADRVLLRYTMPLRELVVDLYDQLKSVTQGYGSLSYDLAKWHTADVVKLSVLVNKEEVEALSVIVAKAKAEQAGRRIVAKLKEVLPRQQFAVPIQAAVGGTVVARETLSALRKDVTSGLYGGDYSRKRKVLEKQKRGKKKLAGSSTIEIPPEAYLAVLKRD